MAHQVLARKWRPRDFASLVGQDHVVRALTHALDTGRLHHAYLFTGTRGVGKTTLARIIAKAVNCETGVRSTPCGKCRACTEIDEGRFVDYIELDAASNRGVDEMTQLLENAIYAPSAGRFKVYVIDEVHMLSNHAFNAMLKTLEEPPGHVLFVLATTDPQRVPVTVLSRCMQLNLRNMPAAAVAGHLARVLEAEGIAVEAPALGLLGRAAAGSMRDALSLLDQAIAFGGGQVGESSVREMLGIVDRRDLARLLDALVAGDGPALVALADDMSLANAPFDRTLAELAGLLQRIAVAGVAAPDDDDPDRELVERLAQAIAPEDLQAWYQIAIHGRRDLPLAPDPASGFTMTLLRLLAFRAGTDAAASGAGTPAERPSAAPRAAAAQARAAARSAAGLDAGSGRAPVARAAPMPPPAAAPAAAPDRVAPASVDDVPDIGPEPPPDMGHEPPPDFGQAGDGAALAARAREFDGDWPALARQLAVSGIAREFMQQSELVAANGLEFTVRVPIRALAAAATVARARAALAEHFGAEVRLTVETGKVQGPTAVAIAREVDEQRLARAQADIEADPFVRTLIDDFKGAIVPGSIRPLDRPRDTGESHA
ncbi:MAG: DNA polymerase III subunit gamma/tau [Burkholderiaceae bacterium]|nr:DNA polymerase III subunit gamma/tau [Burkholderiaceae bacterium]